MVINAESIIAPRPATGRPPAVLQVLPALVTGGVERGTADIAAALVKAGWRAVVASSGGPMVREIERAGAEHIQLPLETKNPFRIRNNIDHLRRIIESRQIDIVHARSRAPAWSALYAARRSGRHFVTTFHNTYGGTTRLKRFYNSVMAEGERVIAISEFVGAHAAEAYGIGHDRLRVIPRGVDVTRFDPDSVHPSRVIALAQQWQLDDERPVIMLPGRITRWKGQAALVDAVAELADRRVQVLFVGNEQSPTYRQELQQRIQGQGLGGLFKMVGDCRDMAAAYMLADVVVSASTRPEGFGRIAVEAQAMGRPVVATDHGGARETVLADDTGWLVPPNDPATMAGAIAAALSLNAEERMDLAARARAWVLSRFDNRLMCQATLAVYEELLFPGQETPHQGFPE